MAIHQSIRELIGNTPLVQLNRYAAKRGLGANILAKIEYFNPAGSVKDRVGFAMLDAAEKAGKLNSETVIIEPTSGNTGIGLAAAAAARGLRIILTMPETMSVERRKLIAGFGAEVVLTPGAKGMKGSLDTAYELAKERGGMVLGQFTNLRAREAHYISTGPEIYRQLDGQADVLVAGVGSGSSLSGTGRFLKERIKGFRVVAVEPSASPVISGGKAGPHAIQGIGAGFIPDTLDVNLLDEVMTMDNDDAISMAKKLISEQGVLCGISSGCNVAAALRIAARPEMKGKNIVTFICDTGERYLSTALYA